MTSPVANAFDGNRQGFIIGLGAGFHAIDIDVLYDDSKNGSDLEGGIATSFKMGWGLTNQFALYYARNVSWYRGLYLDEFKTSDATNIVGIAGLGGVYYLSPSSQSGYFLGAIGKGDVSAISKSNTRSTTGSALMLGGGYEISEHLQIEATLVTTDIERVGFSRLNLKTSSIQFTVNYLWY